MILKKLKDPEILPTFQAEIGGRLPLLTALDGENIETHSVILAFNNDMTVITDKVLGKTKRTKKPWLTPDKLNAWDESRNLKCKQFEPNGTEMYSKVIRKAYPTMEEAK